MPFRRWAKMPRWSNTRQAWEERLGVLGTLAAAAALWFFDDDWPSAYRALAWSGLALVVAVFLRRGWVRLFGPVLFYDLLRSARRTRAFVIRTGYVLLLFVALCWLYNVWAPRHRYGGPIHSSEVAEFAQMFFATFMAGQLFLAVVMTPAYTAGAIAEEKERKTLEFILATDLRDREIVLGKLASRLAHLTLVALAGLPVLSAVQFLGGVDPSLLLAGFAATGLTMLSIAALSILASVLVRRTRDALLLVYLTLIGYVGLSFLSLAVTAFPRLAALPSTAFWQSPLTVADVAGAFQAGNPIIKLQSIFTRGGLNAAAIPGALRDYALFHGILAGGCVAGSVAWLRSSGLKEPRPARNTAASYTAKGNWRPVVGNYPMIWKELWSERGLRLHLLLRIVFVLLFLASFIPPAAILLHNLDMPRGWRRLGEEINVWVRVVGTLVALVGLIGVCIRAATSIRSEKDRDTFDALHASPLSSEEILFGKWLGSLWGMRWVGVWLVLIWGLGMVCDGLTPLAVPLLALSCLVYAAAMAGLGIWCSITCRTTLRAVMATLLLAVLVSVGHWLPWFCCIPCLQGSGPHDEIQFVVLAQGGITPPAVLGGYLPFRNEDFGRHYYRSEYHPVSLMTLTMFGDSCWAGLAVFFWFQNNRRFKTMTGRTGRIPRDGVIPLAAAAAATVVPVGDEPKRRPALERPEGIRSLAEDGGPEEIAAL